MADTLLEFMNARYVQDGSKQVDIYKSLTKQYKFFAVALTEGKKRIFHGESIEEVDSLVLQYTTENPQTHVTFSYR